MPAWLTCACLPVAAWTQAAALTAHESFCVCPSQPPGCQSKHHVEAKTLLQTLTAPPTCSSRECQVAHWKHGGHREQCAQLAAAAGVAAGAEKGSGAAAAVEPGGASSTAGEAAAGAEAGTGAATAAELSWAMPAARRERWHRGQREALRKARVQAQPLSQAVPAAQAEACELMAAVG